jgi:hypothetical protein
MASMSSPASWRAQLSQRRQLRFHHQLRHTPMMGRVPPTVAAYARYPPHGGHAAAAAFAVAPNVSVVAAAHRRHHRCHRASTFTATAAAAADASAAAGTAAAAAASASAVASSTSAAAIAFAVATRGRAFLFVAENRKKNGKTALVRFQRCVVGVDPPTVVRVHVRDALHGGGGVHVGALREQPGVGGGARARYTTVGKEWRVILVTSYPSCSRRKQQGFGRNQYFTLYGTRIEQ